MKQKNVILALFILILAGSFIYLQINRPIEEDNLVNTNQSEEQIDLSAEALAKMDTSGWLTYRNEEYGFEFKYKENWNIEENNIITVIIPNYDDRPLLVDLGRININIDTTTDINVLVKEGRDYLTKSWQDELGVEKDVSEKNIFKNDNSIIFLGPLSPPSGMNERIYILISNVYKTAIISGVIYGGSEVLDQINHILNTFQFID